MMYEQIATRTTPLVRLNLEENEFIIQGRSLPEKGIDFYESIIDWMNQHLADKNIKAVFVVNLEYCNTSSYKGLALLFKNIEKINDNGSLITIKWMYETDDEDWLDDGKTYQELVKVPFVFEEIQQNYNTSNSDNPFLSI